MIKNDGLINERDKLTKQIKEIECNPIQDKMILAKYYWARGNVHINLYLNSYVINQEAHAERAEASFKDYERSIELFSEINGIEACSDKGYALMAYGNAIKEQYLPGLKGSFADFRSEAKTRYESCVKLFLEINEIRGYHFAMLEQMNLSVRKEVWGKSKRPKRIIIFHSLKSSESHRLLHGIRYFAYRNDCEVWEYHYGYVPPSDRQRSFIEDRLKDACAAIFLASKDYDPTREEIIRFEIDETTKLKLNGDPLGVFVVNLGNLNVINSLKKVGKVISPEHLDDEFPIFLKGIKDIYECRRPRCCPDGE